MMKTAGIFIAGVALIGVATAAAARVYLGPPVALSIAPESSNFAPAVATDGNGTLVVVWDYHQHAGKVLNINQDILAARSIDGGATWSAPFVVYDSEISGDGSEADPIGIASDCAGNWVTLIEENDQVLALRSQDAGASWSAPLALGDIDPYGDGALSSGCSGSFVGVWPQQGAVVSIRSDDGGLSWSAPVPIPSLPGSLMATRPTVAQTASGLTIAAWSACPSLEYNIETCVIAVSRSEDGGSTWASPSIIDYASSNPQARPFIANDGGSGWALSWTGLELTDLDGFVINMKRVRTSFSEDGGLSWSTPGLMTTVLPNEWQQQESAIASDGNGEWLSIWHTYGSFAPIEADFRPLIHATGVASALAPAQWDTAQTIVENKVQPRSVLGDPGGRWLLLGNVCLDGGLDVAVVPGSSCGNGVVEYGKACDDGNVADGDGCSSICEMEGVAGTALSLSMRASTPGRGNLSVKSRDHGLTLGRGNYSIDDPVAHGGTLTITDALSGMDETYALPAEYWRHIGRAGENRGYRYSDRRNAAGPIRTILVKPGRSVQIKAKDLSVDLAANPDPVGVTIILGTRHISMQFGGVSSYRQGRIYRAKRAPAP